MNQAYGMTKRLDGLQKLTATDNVLEFDLIPWTKVSVD